VNSQTTTPTPAFATTRQQARALGFAVMVTLAMLGGINLLATQGGADAQMAAAKLQLQALAASAAATATATAKGV